MTRKEEINKASKEYNSYSRLHNIWKAMKQRCFNKNATGYKNYGGRVLFLMLLPKGGKG